MADGRPWVLAHGTHMTTCQLISHDTVRYHMTQHASTVTWHTTMKLQHHMTSLRHTSAEPRGTTPFQSAPVNCSFPLDRLNHRDLVPQRHIKSQSTYYARQTQNRVRSRHIYH